MTFARFSWSNNGSDRLFGRLLQCHRLFLARLLSGGSCLLRLLLLLCCSLLFRLCFRLALADKRLAVAAFAIGDRTARRLAFRFACIKVQCRMFDATSLETLSKAHNSLLCAQQLLRSASDWRASCERQRTSHDTALISYSNKCVQCTFTARCEQLVDNALVDKAEQTFQLLSDPTFYLHKP